MVLGVLCVSRWFLVVLFILEGSWWFLVVLDISWFFLVVFGSYCGLIVVSSSFFSDTWRSLVVVDGY